MSAYDAESVMLCDPDPPGLAELSLALSEPRLSLTERYINPGLPVANCS